jgi:hypothetical protein
LAPPFRLDDIDAWPQAVTSSYYFQFIIALKSYGQSFLSQLPFVLVRQLNPIRLEELRMFPFEFVDLQQSSITH